MVRLFQSSSAYALSILLAFSTASPTSFKRDEADLSRWTPDGISEPLERRAPPPEFYHKTNARADSIPSRDAISKAVQSAPSTNYFWAGRFSDCSTLVDNGVKGVAEALSKERKGFTLEARLRDAGVKIPTFSSSAAAKAAWQYAAGEYIKGTSDVTWVRKAGCSGVGTAWTDIEFPALKANTKVKCIFELPALDWSRPNLIYHCASCGDYCQQKQASYQNALTCSAWTAANWRTANPSSLDIQTTSFRFAQYYGNQFTGTKDASSKAVFSFSREPQKSVTGVNLDQTARRAWLARPNSHITASLDWISDPAKVRQPTSLKADGDKSTSTYAAFCPWTKPGPSGKTLRILPLGASITAGFDGHGDSNGYRLPLLEMLSGNKITFIGSHKSGTMANSNNEGHDGAIISQAADFAKNPAAFPARPNVILIYVGTNDNGLDNDLAHAPNRMGNLIDQALTACPDATVIVATLGVVGSSVITKRISNFNIGVWQQVAQRRSQGKHVLVAEMGDIVTSDLVDGTHPNVPGYKKLAASWYFALSEANSLGWLGQPV